MYDIFYIFVLWQHMSRFYNLLVDEAWIRTFEIVALTTSVTSRAVERNQWPLDWIVRPPLLSAPFHTLVAPTVFNRGLITRRFVISLNFGILKSDFWGPGFLMNSGPLLRGSLTFIRQLPSPRSCLHVFNNVKLCHVRYPNSADLHPQVT